MARIESGKAEDKKSKATSPSPYRQVPALVRAKRILDYLSADGGMSGVSELARSLDIPKSSIHGLCRTLADLGVLARVGAIQFTIGPQVLAWANAFQSQSSLTAEFQRMSLGDGPLSGEALNLTVLSGDSVLYVACRNGTSPLGLSFRTGMSLPAAFTATGKAMLSTYPMREVEGRFESNWPKPFTRYSVRSLRAFKRELAEVRQRGYSIDNGQLREGMFCFGAPVFGANSRTAIAGLAVGLLSVDVTKETYDRYGKVVSQYADELSRRLGATRY